MRSQEFSDESYMNPDPTRLKYKGRDLHQGQLETARRLAYFPQIQKKSAYILTELSVGAVTILVKGSTAIGLCLPSSDLDLAIVVAPLHTFCQYPAIWKQYQEALQHIDGIDFPIHPQLIVEAYHLQSFLPYTSLHVPKPEILTCLYGLMNGAKAMVESTNESE